MQHSQQTHHHLVGFAQSQKVPQHVHVVENGVFVVDRVVGDVVLDFGQQLVSSALVQPSFFFQAEFDVLRIFKKFLNTLVVDLEMPQPPPFS